MARTRQIPDLDVFKKVLALLFSDGEKAVTFASVANLCGLAPSTLVQRYHSCPEMLDAALVAAWQQVEAQTDAAIAASEGKGAQSLLKALSGPISTPALLNASLCRPNLTLRAKAWREMVEYALAARLVVSPRSTETAALIFAAWQGRLLWTAAGGKGFRLGEALKRLG